jgi:hypothetical protein
MATPCRCFAIAQAIPEHRLEFVVPVVDARCRMVAATEEWRIDNLK